MSINLLIIRESFRTKQFLLKLVCRFKSEEHKVKVKNILLDNIDKFLKSDYCLKGLLIEEHNEQGLFVPNDRAKTLAVFGQDSIEEILLDKRFTVPMNSFFQVHTDLAELLYSKVHMLVLRYLLSYIFN